MSVCHSQEVTVAAVFPDSFYFCDISTHLSSVCFPLWVGSTAFAQRSKGKAISAGPFLTWSICLKYNQILRWKVISTLTSQSHFMILNTWAHFFIWRQYWLELEKWTHSIFAGEKSWASQVSERSSLMILQWLKLCKVCWVLGVGFVGVGLLSDPPLS